MKTMKTYPLTAGMATLLTAGLLIFGSCKKKEEKPQDTTTTTQTDNEQSTATDNNTAEVIANDIEAMGSQVSEEGSLSTYRSSSSEQAGQLDLAPCATVTINSAARTITVDFGTAGCVGQDGRTRTGKLIYDYSASSPTSAVFYRNPGYKLTVTSQNYVVENHSVTINNKTIMNTTPLTIPTGTNPGTNLTWSISANISIAKPNNGGTITWLCNRTKELVNTSDPNCYRGQNDHIIWSIARIKLNGTASGTNAKGESYTAVATDLVRNFDCHPLPALRPRWSPFVSGTLAYTPGSRPTRLIDYGTGSCDADATVTINGTTYAFVIQ